MVINSLTNIAKLLQTLPLFTSMLFIRSFMSTDQVVLLAHQLIAKLHLKIYKSLIKPLACVSAHISANAFPIWWLSKINSRSPKALSVKRQKDGWLDTIKEPTLRTSILASFYQSSIADWFLLILRDPEKKFRLGLDSHANLDCRPDGW